jgi:hypothetical protein
MSTRQQRAAETRRVRQAERFRRLRVVLLGWYADGWSTDRIARTLRVRKSSVRAYLAMWIPNYPVLARQRQRRGLKHVGKVVGVICGAGLLLWSATALAMHGSWQDHFYDAFGVPCCGARDCLKAEVWVWRRLPDLVEVEVNGRLLRLPAGSVHTIPADADVPLTVSGYWCARNEKDPVSEANTRCVFVRPGHF